MALDGRTDMRRGERGDQEAEGQAADDSGERPSGAVRDRAGEDRRQVERRAPGEDFDDAQGGDDGEAAAPAGSDLTEAGSSALPLRAAPRSYQPWLRFTIQTTVSITAPR